MPKDLFYLPSYKNVSKLFEKIASAKVPDAFTTRYLADVIGLKSAADRALINMLKKLGFLDASGRPTDSYSLLKNKDVAGTAIADGLRKAYAPLFEANERVHELPLEQLRGLVSQVTGADEKGAKNVAYTFNSIAKKANFSASAAALPRKVEPEEEQHGNLTPPAGSSAGFRSDFHFNIQVHLPANATEETYLHIFNALRRTFS